MTGYAKTAKVDESVDEYDKSREAKVDECIQTRTIDSRSRDPRFQKKRWERRRRRKL
jgi:hypothetical protein